MCVDGVGKFFFLVRLKLLCVLLLHCHVRAAAPRLTLLWLSTDSFPLLPICTVDIFATDVTRRRRHLDLRGVLLHVEFLSAAPQPIGAVCVADVVFDVDV